MAIHHTHSRSMGAGRGARPAGISVRYMGAGRSRASDRVGWPVLEELVTAPPPFAPSGSVPVALRDVESELARQIKVLQGAGEHIVQYARMSNLVIFCDQRSRAESLAAEVPNVIAIHPARVLLLLGESGAEDAP